jgi:hypothetical protein
VNLCKKTDKVWTELYLKKKTADKQWDRVFLEALHGKINQEEMSWAMEQCNIADFNLIEFERFNKKIKQGAKGYSDEEFYRMYIKPYEKSMAP